MTVATPVGWSAPATRKLAPMRAHRCPLDLRARRRPAACSRELSRRAGAGSRASDIARNAADAPRPVLRQAGPRREDRLRRGLHGRRLAGRARHRPGRPADAIRLAVDHADPAGPAAGAHFVDKHIPPDHENTLDGSRANIAAHYDLSNDLFAAFLDPTMSYSCAWFGDSEPIARAAGLEEAQLRKIDGILDLAGVEAGTRLLEIGSGWGSLAIRAAQRGAGVTTITLSREQVRLARDRVEAAGLSDLVQVGLGDYREVDGQYDAIVSVEMVEAVGETYWPAYFATLDRLLAPGGSVAIQAITMAHERFLATRRSFSWIQKYIFPGGIIPSLQAVDETLAAHTTLRVTRQRELGLHYARTVRLWRERFLDKWPHIHAMGFDLTFRRMWEFYLAYSEAGFRSGYLGLSQLQMTRGPA